MATTTVAVRRAVLRRDLWWAEPLAIAVVLTLFTLYVLWTLFQNANYYAAPYLSPLFSPCITANCEHLTFGPIIGRWWNLAPAFWILIWPLGFRATCYYYRRSYYRAFFASPPACAVPDLRARYSGETRFPFVLQNVHRYFFYVALIFIVILSYDVLLALDFGGRFGIGLGTAVMATNVVLLALYTLSCHSCRDLCGGRFDRFWGRPFWHGLWSWISRLNLRHGLYAWLSLFSVIFTDLYIRLVAMGAIADPRIVF